jgi:hypothetical protein
LRFTPLVGKKVWFGPRSGGWGWDPVSWEGWLAIPFWFGLGVGVQRWLEPSPWVPAVVILAGVVATAVLKGTPPGGADAADRFHEMRRNARRTPEMKERDRRLRQAIEDEPSVTAVADRMRRVRPNRDRRR